MNTSLLWSWHHPKGRYNTIVVGGGLFDEHKNIYLATEDGVRKFSPHGEELWHFKPGAPLATCPSLMGGALYGNTMWGEAFALDMRTGRPIWRKKVREHIGSDTAYVEAHNGVVVTGMTSGPSGGNREVLGLDAGSGETLWNLTVDPVVWNFMALFPDDHSTMFMDDAGGVYRVDLQSGSVIWHTPAPEESGTSFSDGGATIGPDRSLYTCTNPGNQTGQEGQQGVLRKFAYEDGRHLWTAELPFPCNSWPAVSADGSAVVVVPGSFNMSPLGGQDPDVETHNALLAAKGHQRDVVSEWSSFREKREVRIPYLRANIMAFDTQTGRELWRHGVEPYGDIAAAGDEEGVLIRRAQHTRDQCLPAHWSAPTIAGDGRVLVGRTSGDLFAYSPEKGESRYHTGTGPLHPGASFAPGLMAYADCDSLYVFRAPQP